MKTNQIAAIATSVLVISILVNMFFKYWNETKNIKALCQKYYKSQTINGYEEWADSNIELYKCKVKREN
tara:strand:- start:375 stop:581 length:207 start_codon:yes stop_codon:yes gene_type:complete